MRDILPTQPAWSYLVATAIAFGLIATEWGQTPAGSPTAGTRPAGINPGTSSWDQGALWVQAHRQAAVRHSAYLARRESRLASLGALAMVDDSPESRNDALLVRPSALAEVLVATEPSSIPPLEPRLTKGSLGSANPLTRLAADTGMPEYHPPYRNLAVERHLPSPGSLPGLPREPAIALPPQNPKVPEARLIDAPELPEVGVEPGDPATEQDASSAETSDVTQNPAASDPAVPAAAAGVSQEPTNVTVTDNADPQAVPANAQAPTTSAVQATAQGWAPPCETMLSYLDQLACECETSVWALQVQAGLCKLTGTSLSERELDDQLARLRQAAAMADTLADHVDRPAVRGTLRRAQQALLRRLNLWEPLANLSEHDADMAGERTRILTLRNAANRADLALGNTVEADRWRAYLLLEKLQQLAPGEPLGVVRQVLERWDAPTLSQSQRVLLARPELQNLEQALVLQLPLQELRWQLLTSLELFESAKAAHQARQVAVLVRRLTERNRQSGAADSQDLGERLEKYYRNANFRIAVSEALVNRVLPDEGPVEGLIRDTVVGVPVRGRSTTYSQLELDLLPSQNGITARLMVHGRVHSRTTSSSGPAHLASRTRSQFHAEKVLVLGKQGLQASPAQAQATASSDLVRLSTDFDPVPLVGAMVRSIARSRNDELKPQVRRETEQKVQERAEAEFDNRVQEQLQAAEKRYQDQFLTRLTGLKLQLDAIQLDSTEDRAVARLRMAGDDQLAAYTPRPQALADSLASVQVHESAINNFLDRLELAGKDFSLQELQSHLCQRLNLEFKQHRELPEDFYIYFATEDPVRIRLDQGAVQICLKLDGLARGDQEYGSVDVNVAYQVDMSGPFPVLVRGETVSLSGRKIGFRERMALQGVFAKLFPKDKRVPLAIDKFTQDPRFTGLRLSQVVFQDGWLGISVSEAPAPVAVAGRRSTARRLMLAGPSYW